MLRIPVLALAAGLLGACSHGSLDLTSRNPGRNATQPPPSGGDAGPYKPQRPFFDLRGRALNEADGAGSLAGWLLALVDTRTGAASVASIDAGGGFTIGDVARYGGTYALALLTPDHLVASVYAAPATEPGKVRPFFTIGSGALPQVTRTGGLLCFDDASGIHPENDLAGDANGDGVPDGVTALTALAAAPSTEADTDKDGRPNAKDPDIDGDGLVNWLDADEDGNGVGNAADADSNADGVADALQGGGTSRFAVAEGAVNVDVTVATERDTEPKPWRGADYLALTFSFAASGAVGTITSVQVRAPSALIAGAVVEAGGAAEAWSGDLAAAADGATGDRLFARRVILADGHAPRVGQVFFFRVTYTVDGLPLVRDYPYVVSLAPAAFVSAQYDANTQTVVLVGNPFGSAEDFKWYVTLLDAQGRALWYSPTVPGTRRQTTFSASQLTNAARLQVTAAMPDKAPGLPTYLSRTTPLDL